MLWSYHYRRKNACSIHAGLIFAILLDGDVYLVNNGKPLSFITSPFDSLRVEMHYCRTCDFDKCIEPDGSVAKSGSKRHQAVTVTVEHPLDLPLALHIIRRDSRQRNRRSLPPGHVQGHAESGNGYRAVCSSGRLGPRPSLGQAERDQICTPSHARSDIPC